MMAFPEFAIPADIAPTRQERNLKTKYLGGFEVDHQLVLNRGLDGKLARLCALEDAVGISRCATKIIGLDDIIGQQAAEFSEETSRIYGRQTVASRQRCKLCAMSECEGFRNHDQAHIWLASLRGND
jgi:hypothetical protein